MEINSSCRKLLNTPRRSSQSSSFTTWSFISAKPTAYLSHYFGLPSQYFIDDAPFVDGQNLKNYLTIPSPTHINWKLAQNAVHQKTCNWLHIAYLYLKDGIKFSLAKLQYCYCKLTSAVVGKHAVEITSIQLQQITMCRSSDVVIAGQGLDDINLYNGEFDANYYCL